MRIALGIEYDGTAYNGWQRQRNGVGVQTPVEDAVGRIANETVGVTCAGRTDAGVHANAQVVHFDSTAQRSNRSWLLGVNSKLPDDINVTWSKSVDPDFHARFSAESRTYRYLILNRQFRSALYRRRAWWVYQALDAARMQAAANFLIGEHDFSAFRAAGCQASGPVRKIFSLRVVRQSDWLGITVTANAFLQHMVRNIAGLLVEVGSGTKMPSWAETVLQGRDRTEGAVAAPAHGLTLTGVEYPGRFALPAAVDEEILLL